MIAFLFFSTIILSLIGFFFFVGHLESVLFDELLPDDQDKEQDGENI